MVRARASYLGRCLVQDDGETLDLLDLVHGTHARLDGRLRAAWLGGAGPLRDAACAASPTLRALSDACAAASPSRQDLLRGTGYGLLFVELTAQCNERCTHCYADAAPERREQLSREQVRTVLEAGRAAGFCDVQFTGGDPLLHPALLDVVDDARALGYAQVEAFTNGLALDSSRLEALAERGVALAFSVYSHDPDAHDAVTRTPSSHARTLRAVERAVARGLRVRVAVTAMAEVPCDREVLVARLESLGLPREAVRFTESRSVGRGLRHGRLDDEAHGHGLASAARSGKACVAATGEVFPCIFGRELPLGTLDTTGLVAALASVDGALPDPDAFARALGDAEARFGCLECRIRAAAMTPRRRLPTTTGRAA